MISVAVLAALAATVTLSVARPGSDTRTDWSMFRDVHDRMRQEAAMSGTLRAVHIDETGYQPLRWSGAWQEEGPRRSWRGDVAVLRPFRGDAPIEFAPSGQVTRFQIRFGGETGARLCESDGWGPMTCRGS